MENTGILPSSPCDLPAAKCNEVPIFSLWQCTEKLFFPFLTTEVKRHPDKHKWTIDRTPKIEIAECQNAHSMAVAMRNVVGLYRRWDPKKLKDVHGRILGFFIPG
ncbi:hypothetical protein BDW68DRAFT_156083 [Aspergillus falconensis]